MSEKTADHEVVLTFTADEYLGMEALALRYNEGSISDYVKELVRKDVRHFAMATTEGAGRKA
jgi:hypothetical protein